MLITEDEYLTKKSKDLISLKCVLCSETFLRTKHEVNWARIRSSKQEYFKEKSSETYL